MSSQYAEPKRFVVKVVPCFNREYAMIQYELDGKRFWRCRHIRHPDVRKG